MEKLKNMLEGNSIYTNIEDIYDSLNKIKGKGLLQAINTGAPAVNKSDPELMETIDSKIE